MGLIQMLAGISRLLHTSKKLQMTAFSLDMWMRCIGKILLIYGRDLDIGREGRRARGSRQKKRKGEKY